MCKYTFFFSKAHSGFLMQELHEGWKRHPFLKRSGVKDRAESPTLLPSYVLCCRCFSATRACPNTRLSDDDSFFKKDGYFFCWKFLEEIFLEDEFFIVKGVSNEISKHELVVECQDALFD